MKRGGWGAAGVPAVEDYTRVGAWFAGTPEEFVAHLRSLEQKYPGLEYIHVSNSMGTPQSVMLEQLAWFAKEVSRTSRTASDARVPGRQAEDAALLELKM